MAHYAGSLKRGHVIEDARGADIVKIGLLVNAMQKSEVNIVGAELLKLPRKGLFYLREIALPAVFSVRVVYRAEVELEEYLFPHSFYRASEGRVDRRSTRAKVKKVDAVFYGAADNGFYLIGSRGLYAAHPKTQRAYFLAAVRQYSVFLHSSFSNCAATSRKSERIGRGWGHERSHFPQPMQSDALPLCFVYTP